MSATVVVTGASGFIGSHVLRALRSQPGIRAIGVARKRATGVSRVSSYSETPAGDVLVHLAEGNDRASVAAAGPEYAESSLATLRALLAKAFARVVYVSSAAVYGDTKERPHPPTDTVHATDPYASAKRRCEMEALSHASGVVTRLANAYGPGMSPDNVVSTILGQIPGEGPLGVRDTSPVRDFIWAEDAAEGIVSLALAGDLSSGTTFNVGTGSGTSIGELARIALEVAGEPDRTIVASSRGSRRSVLIVDSSDTTAACGWRARVGVREGMTRLVRDKQEAR